MKCMCCNKRRIAIGQSRKYCLRCKRTICRIAATPQSQAEAMLERARLRVLRIEIAMFPERFAPPVGCAPAKEKAPTPTGEIGAAGDKSMAETA